MGRQQLDEDAWVQDDVQLFGFALRRILAWTEHAADETFQN